MSKLSNADILKNWTTVNEFLQTTTDEDRIQELLALERGKGGKHRMQVITRLYGRASRLRMQREQQELFGRKS